MTMNEEFNKSSEKFVKSVFEKEKESVFEKEDVHHACTYG